MPQVSCSPSTGANRLSGRVGEIRSAVNWPLHVRFAMIRSNSPGAIRLPRIAFTDGVPIQYSRRSGCSAAKTMASAATSGL